MTVDPRGSNTLRLRTLLVSILSVFFFFLATLPAAAQCLESECGTNDGTGPQIAVTPDGQTYLVDIGTSRNVAFTATLSDTNRVNASSIAVTLNDSPIQGWTWEPSLSGPGGTVRGTVSLSQVGDNHLYIDANDDYGNHGSGYALMRVELTDPELPFVYNDVHHGGYRDTTRSQLSLVYSMPAYTSMSMSRGVALQYISELASPTMFVQVDAQVNPRTAANVTAVSLRVEDSAGNLVVPESFWTRHPGGGKQRLGAFASLATQPTGAVTGNLIVRSHFANGTSREVRVPTRLMVVNESRSRYGSGWTLAGIPRIYGAVGGVMLHEGNGVLRWIESIPCTPYLCTFKRPEGDFAEMIYDRVANRMVRTYIDGAVETFNEHGLLISAKDSFGRTTTFAWQKTVDAAPVWVLTSITDPMQKSTTFAYSGTGYLQSITDPAGRTVTVTINASGDLTALSGPTTLQVAYGINHLPTSFTDENGTWIPAFERGTFSSFSAAGSAVPLTKFLRAEWKVQPLPGQGTSLTNRAAALDPANAVEQVVDAGGHTISTRTLNRYGQPLRVVDLLGDVTTYGWTADSLLSSVAENGRTVEYDWNVHGRLVATRVNGDRHYEAGYGTRPDRPDYEITGTGRQWFEWGPRGELVRSWPGAYGSSTGSRTTYGYDALYRLASMSAPGGERSEWTYDAVWGNVASVRNIHGDGSAQTVSYVYDTAGRGQSVTNALGQVTRFAHDSRNRVREITDPLNRVTKLDYTRDRLTSVTDPAGKIFGYTYNALGLLESETFPQGPPRTYTYNAEGLMLSRTDRRGPDHTTRFTYDAMHRPLTRVADNATTTYDYPDRYTVTEANAEARTTTAIDAEYGRLKSIRMTLSGLSGRLFELKPMTDPENETHVLGTDLDFYLNGVKQRTESVRYDATPTTTGGVQFVITDPKGRRTTLLYDSSGNHIRTTYPNAVVRQDSYSADKRLTATSVGTSTTNQSLGASFAYDGLYRLSMRTSPDATRQWMYGYTAGGEIASFKELTSAVGGNSFGRSDPSTSNKGGNRFVPAANGIVRSTAFAYDVASNRTDSGAVIVPNTNRYATFRGYTLEYDLEGNVIRKWKSGFDQRLQWNTLGQLASVTTNGAVVTFGYDPSGRRVRRTADGSSRYFLYEQDDLLLELGADGAPTRTYLHLPGTDRPLSVRDHSYGGSESVRYYVLEQPGHVRGLLDSTGTLVGEYAYTPFGEALPTTKGDGTTQPLRFMGRELDAGTRLYNVRNRWYDPELGRFISEDPIGLAGGLNTYAYVGNDPMNGRDPSGLQQEETCLSAGCDATLVMDALRLNLCRGFCAPPWWTVEQALFGLGDSLGLGSDPFAQFRQRDQGPATTPAIEEQRPPGDRTERRLQCSARTMSSSRSLIAGASKLRNEGSMVIGGTAAAAGAIILAQPNPVTTVPALEGLGLGTLMAEGSLIIGTALFQIGVISGQGYNEIGCLLFPGSW